MKRTLAALLLLFAFTANAEKAMTKADAIALLSKSKEIKKKETSLFNWDIGYDLSRINRVRLTPIINFVKAAPKRLPPDGRTILELTASIDDPGGIKNISGVRADLSNIGKFSNMTLVDNGLYGDQVSGDGVYTLQSTVNPAIAVGDKEIPITAANKKGWLAVSKTSIAVEKNPAIIAALALPDKVSAGDNIYLEVNVDNPGRNEDCLVYADLSPIGGGEVKLVFLKDSAFAQNILIPPGTPAGPKNITIQITNLAGGKISGIISFEVIK